MRYALAPGIVDNAPMEIILNGQPHALRDGTSLGELLQAQLLGDRRVAVEVNGQIVPRGRHNAYLLHAGDRVEIVHALGGG